ncbi:MULTISPECIES: SGNH/GDSL hydrolase family protein [unclassified Frondihabitans]|uniref:SGNH/GDSL hydrolase family protein n=1 Tax=unclassified Frondihabitans TaxID=2626248 RepID=UPI000F50949C|nr:MULTISPECIES: SGNH/GDSL hydrolase family protein [unclassified Frondihabitans]
MRAVTRILVGGLLTATIVVLAGCATLPHSEPNAGGFSTVAPMATGAPVPEGSTPGVRVAIVGDSLTAGGGRSLSEGLTPNTWITYAKGNGVDYVGGWAVGGTTIQQMAAAVKPIAKVDVLVLMAGTNDVRHKISFADSRASYEKVIATLHPKHVIIGAIPPNNRHPRQAALYEKHLHAYALAAGYDFVDPWGFARDGDVYAPGTSLDGTHPTTAGYRLVGLAYRDAIVRVMATPKVG